MCNGNAVCNPSYAGLLGVLPTAKLHTLLYLNTNDANFLTNVGDFLTIHGGFLGNHGGFFTISWWFFDHSR